MTNPFLGEVTVDVDGTRWTLRMDFNAMCAFEDETGENAVDAMQSLDDGKAPIRTMRHLVRAALSEHHPEATLRDAGRVMSAYPGALARLMAAIAPEADPEAKAGNARRPKVASSA